MQPRFGEWLRTCREKRGWSQRQTAGRAACSSAYVSRLESDRDGHRRPSVELVVRFADALREPRGDALAAAGYVDEVTPDGKVTPYGVLQALRRDPILTEEDARLIFRLYYVLREARQGAPKDRKEAES
jgi:transcriptional regulator with XRE-family HTH domain